MAYLNAVIRMLKSLKEEKAEVEKSGVKEVGKYGTSHSKLRRLSSSSTETTARGAESSASIDPDKQLDEAVRGNQFCLLLLFRSIVIMWTA